MIFIIPNGWSKTTAPFPNQKAFIRFTGLLVLVSEEKQQDNCLWRHVSLSYKNKMPAYKDIKMVKDIFIGDDLKAIQVFPKKKEHVNFFENCLHLWCNLEKDYLPDFSGGLPII